VRTPEIRLGGARVPGRSLVSSHCLYSSFSGPQQLRLTNVWCGCHMTTDCKLAVFWLKSPSPPTQYWARDYIKKPGLISLCPAWC